MSRKLTEQDGTDKKQEMRKVAPSVTLTFERLILFYKGGPDALSFSRYTSWAMLDMEAVYPQDALIYLMDMHEIVAPLLQKIGHKTRVIVTSQSRFKINAGPGHLHYYSIPYGDPTNEWSEAVFLHHLRRHSQHQPPPSPSGTPEALSDSAAEVLETQVCCRESRSRDHLVPEVNDGGVWWWDTILPLSLAENSECEELYLRNLTLHPMYNSSFYKCNNDNHAGTVTLGDQVTMLLNLVCNTMLGGREGLCCS